MSGFPVNLCCRNQLLFPRAGEFGDVYQGMLKLDGQKSEKVAIKMLKVLLFCCMIRSL